MTSAFRTWSNRLDDLTLTKYQISQFAQAISRRAMGAEARGKRTNLTDDEAVRLYRRILGNPVYLTSGHASQGITWLSKYGAKVLGMTREEMTERVQGFDHFTWNGAIRFGRYFTLPIWTVHQCDGTVWQYFNASWVTRTYDGASEAAWWEGVINQQSSVEDDYDYEVWSEQQTLEDTAHSLAAGDHEIAAWQDFVTDMRKRSERLRHASA